ncbi:hypothetical protein SLEP1_g16542 [Rubroshorea leprosula]|uniref:Uncharacterized protein n=1 Tax=Rubroshorea leprosula TaxID=152421 RepID=A0AAV5IYT2_9ROSI|nr:hypothetical protein SLEP1_g16542 [Rubroshorea leprosula]
MAQSSTYPFPPSGANPLPNNVLIISPHFYRPYPVDLSIVRNVMPIKDSELVGTGIDGNIIFKVKGSSIFSLHSSGVLLDAAGNPIVKTKDNNTNEKVCDFKVKGSWLERSCVAHAGESSTIVAQMHKKITVESVLIGKDNLMQGRSQKIMLGAKGGQRLACTPPPPGSFPDLTVTVYPNIDFGFIVALVVILTAINESDQQAAAGQGAIRGATAGATAGAC